MVFRLTSLVLAKMETKPGTPTIRADYIKCMAVNIKPEKGEIINDKYIKLDNDDDDGISYNAYLNLGLSLQPVEDPDIVELEIAQSQTNNNNDKISIQLKIEYIKATRIPK